MKKLGRFFTGLLFITAFVGFLLVSVVQFRVLSAKAWKGVLKRSGMYEQFSGKIGEFAGQAVNQEELDKAKAMIGTGQLTAEEEQQVKMMIGLTEGIQGLEGKLSPTKLEEIVGNNLDNVLGFLKKKRERLVLYLPVEELGLPAGLFEQPGLQGLSKETDFEEWISQSSTPEKVEETMASLAGVRKIVGYVGLVWIGLMGLMVLLLVGHYFLGEGLARQVRGVSWLLMLSGLIGLGVVGAVGQIFKNMLNNMQQLGEFGLVLAEEIVGQLLGLIKGISLGAGAVGLGGLAGMMYLVKSGKVKVEVKEKKAEEPGAKKKKLIVIGVVIVVLGLLAAKCTASVRKLTTAGGGEVFQGDVYESEYGWMMSSPAGWMINERQEYKAVGFVTPDKQTGEPGWAFVAVEPSERIAAVDQAGFLANYERIFMDETREGAFKGVSLAEPSTEDEWQGYKRFKFVFDHDFQGKQIRQVRWYVFPVEGGDGWLIYSQTLVDSWDGLKDTIYQAMESFKE